MEPFDPQDGGHFWKLPDRYINAITDDDNKWVRRNTLKILLKEMTEYQEKWKANTKETCSDKKDAAPTRGDGDSIQDVTDHDEHEQVLRLVRPLMKTICEPVESCREIGYAILSLILPVLSPEEKEIYLPFIVPPLLDRFGEPEILEPSEEVRLTAVKFLTTLMESVDKKTLLPYVEDLIQILSYLIADPFHLVKIAACQATSYLALKSKGVFHATSDKLLSPLCVSMTHQQFRVRSAVIECLGDVILFGNHKTINDVLPHVTQRLFDTSPNVRKLVIAVSANWMMNFVDRYSYFTKLLPIILTGLSDESPENQELGVELWKKVGTQYLQENEDEYKDEINFPKILETDESPWQKNERPILGCRILVWRHVGNIIPGVVNDITDWVPTTRIKCAQILYQLVLHTEDKIVMHTQRVVKGLTMSINDENATVVNYIRKTAALIGYFVPLASSFPLLVTGITSSSTLGPLKVLHSVIEGTKRADLDSIVEEIGRLLVDKEISQTLHAEKQAVLMEIGIVVTNKVSTTVAKSTQLTKNLFRLAITVLAMAKDPAVVKAADQLLEKLGEVQKMETVGDLVNAYCGDILEDIRGNSSEWTALSPDKLVFERILGSGPMIINTHTQAVLSICTENLSPKRDPEVRLRFFSMLAENLPHCKNTSQHQDKFHFFVKHVIEEVLTPNLVWVAGKTASALRTASSSCILSILNQEILPCELLTTMTASLVPALVSLLDDSILLTRQIACQSLGKLTTSCSTRLSPDLTNKIYPVLVKRLDDVSNEVRLEACMALDATFRNLSKDYDPEFYKLHIAAVISALIVHLDDDDECIRDATYDILVVLGKLRPEELGEACEKFRKKHRTPDLCDSLLNETLKNAEGFKGEEVGPSCSKSS